MNGMQSTAQFPRNTGLIDIILLDSYPAPSANLVSCRIHPDFLIIAIAPFFLILTIDVLSFLSFLSLILGMLPTLILVGLFLGLLHNLTFLGLS